MMGENFMGSKMKGFTLIELMIVVVIIAILAAVAYPSYQDSVTDSRRSDAQGVLMGFAGAMERHYTNSSSYTAAAAGGADTGSPQIYATESPLDGASKYYDLTIFAANDSTYILRATPKNAQAGDGYLEILSTGVKRWETGGGVNNCWAKSC